MSDGVICGGCIAWADWPSTPILVQVFVEDPDHVFVAQDSKTQQISFPSIKWTEPGVRVHCGDNLIESTRICTFDFDLFAFDVIKHWFSPGACRLLEIVPRPTVSDGQHQFALQLYVDTPAKSRLGAFAFQPVLERKQGGPYSQRPVACELHIPSGKRSADEAVLNSEERPAKRHKSQTADVEISQEMTTAALTEISGPIPVAADATEKGSVSCWVVP